MRAVFINPSNDDRPVVRDMAGGLGFDGSPQVVLPPLDLAYLAAGLLAAGGEALIIDAAAEGLSDGQVLQRAAAYRPDWIIADVSLATLERDCAFLRSLAFLPGRKAAKTGISYAPLLEEIIAKSGCEVCVFGECEAIISGVLEGTERAGTARLVDGKLCVVESPRPAFDTLPVPARQLLPNEKYRYLLLGERVATVQTSRGCPFPCASYCPYPAVQGTSWRGGAAGYVIGELSAIVSGLGIRKILFRDATFTMDRARTVEICAGIRGLGLEWWCETRVDRLDPDLLAIMRDAGCKGINVGVETGDAALMETRAKAGLTIAKLVALRACAKKLGVSLHFLLIVGFPGEDKNSLYRTYELLTRLRPESAGVCILTPYPGTPLFTEALAKGWIEDREWSRYGGHHAVMHTDHLHARELEEAYALFTRGIGILRRGGIFSRLRLMLHGREFRRWVRGG